MDSVLDVFQGFVANPEPYMEALGLRVKRQADDFTVKKERDLSNQRYYYVILLILTKRRNTMVQQKAPFY